MGAEPFESVRALQGTETARERSSVRLDCSGVSNSDGGKRDTAETCRHVDALEKGAVVPGRIEPLRFTALKQS